MFNHSVDSRKDYLNAYRANNRIANADKTVIYGLAFDRLLNILSTVGKHHHQYLCQGLCFILRRACLDSINILFSNKARISRSAYCQLTETLCQIQLLHLCKCLTSLISHLPSDLSLSFSSPKSSVSLLVYGAQQPMQRKLCRVSSM